MFKVNPYRPGAGLMPAFLAGRDDEIDKMTQIFQALALNIPVQSVIFSGLRGVGKTVLINKLQRIAEDNGVFCRHIEVEMRRDFISQIATCCQVFLREVSVKEKAKRLLQKAIDSIKSLVISFDPGEGSFSLSIEDKDLYQSMNLTQSLTDVFISIGNVAYETENPICFFIDELQYLEKEELGALIAALHRANQLGYPIMIVGAGLPKIYKVLSEEKSYSERLFMFENIGSLDNDQSIKAIVEPAKTFHVSYTEEALNKIVDITKGYPFFIQQFCKIIFNNSSGNCIDIDDVEKSVDEFFQTMDNGFFRVRYERCSEGDKKFLFAMTRCGELPCTISNVSRYLRKKVKSISPIRAQLINKGIVYPVRHSELDFTVPEFSGFIERLDEYKEWCEENAIID